MPNERLTVMRKAWECKPLLFYYNYWSCFYHVLIAALDDITVSVEHKRILF